MNPPRALVLLAMCASAQAADIGGYLEEKARLDALLIDDCATLPAVAVRTPRDAPNAANLYFATGMCYLESPKLPRDTLAAAVWLRRAANLGHQGARRVLSTLPLPAPSSPTGVAP
jgi:TPR repeat protein